MIGYLSFIKPPDVYGNFLRSLMSPKIKLPLHIRTFTSIIPVGDQKLCLHPNLHRTASSPISSLLSLEQGHLEVVEGQAGSRWGHTQGHSNGTEHTQPISASAADRSVALATEDCPNLTKSENVN